MLFLPLIATAVAQLPEATHTSPIDREVELNVSLGDNRHEFHLGEIIDRLASIAKRSIKLSICLDQQGSKSKKDEQATNVGERCYDDTGCRCRISPKFLEGQWDHRASHAAKGTTYRDSEEHYDT